MKIKRLIAVLVCMAMVFGVLPVFAIGESEDLLSAQAVIEEGAAKIKAETESDGNFATLMSNNMTIDKDLKLTGDMHTAGSLYLDGGTIALNGHTLTVDGDLIQSRGTLSIDGGKLNVGGGYYIAQRSENNDSGKTVYEYSSASALLKMVNEADYVKVNGDFMAYGDDESGLLTAGTMEIGGNFRQLSQYGGSSHNFNTSGTHKVIFTGTGNREIYFANPSFSGFTNVEFLNGSISIPNGIRGFGLTRDLTITSDFLRIYETLELNGHTLNVTGDLIQAYGTLFIDGGKLNVGGGYYIADRSEVSGSGETVYEYSSVAASLKMVNEADRVKVNGDFVAHGVDESGLLTAGTMEIGGNFSQYGGSSHGGSPYSFNTSGTHKVIFTGTGNREIYFAKPSASGFTNVEFLNGSISIPNGIKGFVLSNDLTLTGNFLGIDGTLDLNGHTLNIKGDLVQSRGTLFVNGGKLNVDGGYYIAQRSEVSGSGETAYNYSSASALLKMVNEADRVQVNGDFMTYGDNEDGLLTAGTMEIGGNFGQYEGNPDNFNTGGTHKVIFTGTGNREIYFANPSASGFTNVEFLNGSISIPNGIRGFVLSNDLTLTGDFLKIHGTLDMNGHTLNVKGDLVQTAGTLFVNGGRLSVDGGYYIANRSEVSDNGETVYEYSGASALLKMVNEADCVQVNGDFMAYGDNEEGSLTVGTMEIGGNFGQYGVRKSFSTGGTHKVIFTGKGNTKIYFEVPDYSGFTNVEIASQTGSIDFTSRAKVSSTLTQPGGADVINRDYVTLDGKTAFEDHGELNAEINKYVGNAENVIPTWKDYKAYSDYLQQVVAVTGVSLDKTAAKMTVGESMLLTATVAPSNATNKAVTWKSSNTAVATVENGVVKAVKAGSATITVTTADGGKTASCEVTVDEVEISLPYTVNSFETETPSNGRVYARISVTKNEERAGADALVIAVYNKNGELIDTSAMQGAFEKGQTMTFRSRVFYEEGCTMKAFVWESYEDMVPISNVIEH